MSHCYWSKFVVKQNEHTSFYQIMWNNDSCFNHVFIDFEKTNVSTFDVDNYCNGRNI